MWVHFIWLQTGWFPRGGDTVVAFYIVSTVSSQLVSEVTENHFLHSWMCKVSKKITNSRMFYFFLRTGVFSWRTGVPSDFLHVAIYLLSLVHCARRALVLETDTCIAPSDSKYPSYLSCCILWTELKMCAESIQNRTHGDRMACAILGAGILGCNCWLSDTCRCSHGLSEQSNLMSHSMCIFNLCINMSFYDFTHSHYIDSAWSCCINIKPFRTFNQCEPGFCNGIMVGAIT